MTLWLPYLQVQKSGWMFEYRIFMGGSFVAFIALFTFNCYAYSFFSDLSFFSGAKSKLYFQFMLQSAYYEFV